MPLADDETLTDSVIVGQVAPAASASLRVHCSGDSVQVQPVPPMAVAVMPAGSVSDNVTVPAEGPVPTLLTTMLYEAG